MAIYSDLNQSNTGDTPLKYDVDAILQSVQNILLTRPSSRFFNPEFGTDLADYLFELNDPLTTAQIETFAFESITKWDLRVKINHGKSSVTPIPDKNKYEVFLQFEIEGSDGTMFKYKGELKRNYGLPLKPQTSGLVYPVKTDKVPPALSFGPLAGIGSDITVGTKPLAVNFYSLSTDRDGIISKFIWDFNDGSDLEEGQQVSHTFTEEGKYSVKLKVIDNTGFTAFAEIAIDVREFDPSPNLPLKINYRVRTGDNVEQTVSFLVWNTMFQGAFKVPHVVDGLWDGTYKYLFPAILPMNDILPNISKGRYYFDGVPREMWRWGL